MKAGLPFCDLITRLYRRDLRQRRTAHCRTANDSSRSSIENPEEICCV
jgi:hypothetical protein